MARVLLVEDNEANRDMLSRRLASRGYQISIATDGRQGIAAAQAEQPDIILMDMNLPEIDGWEATRFLKSQLTTRHIPVIALTAHAMVSDRQRALEVGCDDYDTKPVELSRLLSKMAALIERESQR
jgi:two-component system cell cycle response regulator DivK